MENFAKAKLNLGCGQFPRPDCTNVDASNLAKADVIHDLNEFPYPFYDEEFVEVIASHVLEHLEDPFRVMRELGRITKQGGKIIIAVPHFSRGFSHPGHCRGFDFNFPLYFDENFVGGYTGIRLELYRMRMHWFGQPYLKRKILPIPAYYVMRGLSIFLDFLAWISPPICSRLWCFWVGGFEEIVFDFRKPKEMGKEKLGM